MKTLTRKEIRKATSDFLDFVTGDDSYGKGTQRRAQSELDRRDDEQSYLNDPAEIAAREHNEHEGLYDYHSSNR